MPAADTATADAFQADAQAVSQADSNQTGADGQEPKVYDAEYVGKLRSEAASYRTRLSNAEKRLGEIENGQLSEMQKLQKQLETAQSERDALSRDARLGKIAGAAAKAQAKYPDAVARLVPDDAEDIDSVMKQLRKDYPDMFRASSADGGAGQGQDNKPTDMNSLIRARLNGR